MPIGSIICFSSSNIPDSYLFCDGSEVPIIEYPLLYSVIGTQYNRPGINTSLFFHLPDLRNQFIRCIDQSRTLGSIQNWSTGMPTNKFTTDSNGNHSHTTDVQGNHTHSYTRSFYQYNGLYHPDNTVSIATGLDNPTNTPSGAISAAGSHSHIVDSCGDL